MTAEGRESTGWLLTLAVLNMKLFKVSIWDMALVVGK